jgi:SAM-dependent methyltransferase
MMQSAKKFLKRFVPEPVRKRLRGLLLWPPRGLFLGRIFAQAAPLNRDFGFCRGLPIDRYYIEQFLQASSNDIRGRVLEVADRDYTARFGGRQVTQSDILHVTAGHRQATVIADLTRGDNLPTDSFDCIILTQTLQFIYDVPAAIKTLHRILAPEGALLATLPGISQISRYDMERWGECWRFTTLSARRLLEACFPPGRITVAACGNVLAATGLLHGLAAEDLGGKLDRRDPDYQLLITVRAVKLGGRA